MSTITIPQPDLDPTANTTSGPLPSVITAPASQPGLLTASRVVAGRTLRQFWRTPQLIVVSALTSAMFLLIFRYVFGGAIGTGGVSYADYLIPGIAAASGLFASGAVGVAGDIETGLFDRLRSLPIPRGATLIGRSMADTVLTTWATTITVAIGFATGFRAHGSVGAAVAAFALCILFGAAFSWVFILMGLLAGSAQAAQGMSFLTFPFVFVSSAYVPVRSMPGWLQPVAEHQPVTMMVGAVRSLALGDRADAILGHSTAYFVVRALIWTIAAAALFATAAMRRFARS
jgi:ABC-2 type transport system permease protein